MNIFVPWRYISGGSFINYVILGMNQEIYNEFRILCSSNCWHPEKDCVLIGMLSSKCICKGIVVEIDTP